MKEPRKPLDRIWAFHDGPFVGLFVGKEERGAFVAEYIRSDIVDDLIAKAKDAGENS